MGVIALLTFSNTLGLRYGKLIQNVFTKTGRWAVCLCWGFFLEETPPRCTQISVARGMHAGSTLWSLFSADSWHNNAFAAAEVKQPERNVRLAMVIGATVVIVLYVLANIAYLVTLPLEAIQHAPADRLGTATLRAIFPGVLRSWRRPSWSRPSARSTPSP
jgi:APA family basic amino acid/polyamine antiporter